MAGRTPREALKHFLSPLRRSVSCVTKDPILDNAGACALNVPYALRIGGGNGFKLKCDTELWLKVSIGFQLIEFRQDPDRGPFKVKTTSYGYTLLDKVDNDYKEIFSYQWHAAVHRIKYPHLHLPHAKYKKCHLPTGRMALEQVLQLLLDEFDVKALRKGWPKILSDNQTKFETWRTWHHVPPP